MSYEQTLSKHRRLTILKFLAGSMDYTSNASILVDVCNGFGVTSSRDQVASEIYWLKEQGFVTYEDNQDVVVVTATERGVDVSAGRASNDGVQRPRPGG